MMFPGPGTMNAIGVDASAARRRLASRGWIGRDVESFRHLPPPAAEVWLGEEAGMSAAPGETPAPTGAGWTLHAIAEHPQGRVDARWLDTGDAGQRSELLAGLPLAEVGDAAPFAWAHRALCRHGLRLRIGEPSGAGADPAMTTWLQLRHQPRAAVEAPLLVIEVLAGTRCVLVETHEREAVEGQRAIVQNLHAHIRLGEGATLQHVRVATPRAGERIAHHLHVQLGRGARYDQALIASASAYHLQRSEIELQSERSAARVFGVLFAAGSALEQQVQVAHDAPRTSSSVESLVLASGNARAVVNAHTRIAPGADEAAVRQRLSGIPISGQPKLVLRPHLEIHHDAVQAAHGATWGALPQDALFYARQRGLDERHARALVIEGMAIALLERCLDGPALLQALQLDALLARTVAEQFAAATEARNG